MSVTPGRRLPFIGTFVVLAPWPMVRAAYASLRGEPFLSLELHAVDLLGPEDGLPEALARSQPDLGRPLAAKLARLRQVLEWVARDFQLVPLREAARSLELVRSLGVAMFERLSGETRQRLKRLTLELAGDRSAGIWRRSPGTATASSGWIPSGSIRTTRCPRSPRSSGCTRTTSGWRRTASSGSRRAGCCWSATTPGSSRSTGRWSAWRCSSSTDPPRAVRAMVEKWAASLPYVSTLFARSGQIVGTPENCRRLLQSDEAIMVFPEGVRGITKLWPQRYQLQEFGLGFMRLALETQTPIVPVAVVGAEEQAPALLNLKPVGKLLGFPALPVTVTAHPAADEVPPLLRGAADLHRDAPDDEDAELDKKVRVVKTTLQALLQQGLEERKHVFW